MPSAPRVTNLPLITVYQAAKWLLISCLALVAACQTKPESHTAPVKAPVKYVVIDKTTQMLRAYEGKQVVFQSRVSTGKIGKATPNGKFRAGIKHRMHRSTLYDNAPMPFSVQVTGNYFIHGYSHVPAYPASHGCIRLPLTDGNPAEWFFNWVKPGTPIEIAGRWQG